MSVSVIEVTSLHSIPVVPLDGSVTLSTVSGDTVYYGQDQTVSASNKTGSLTVGGGSVTLTVQGWIVSAGVSAVQMVSGTPRADGAVTKAEVIATGLTGPDIGAAAGFTPTAVKSAPYTLAAGEYVPVDASGGTVALTLPTAPADKTRVGFKIVAQAATPNNVTVTRGGSDVFNKAGGSTTLTFSALNTSVILQYAASSGIWYAQSTDTPLNTASGAAKLGTDGTVGGSGGSPLSSTVALTNRPTTFAMPTDSVAITIQLVNGQTSDAFTIKKGDGTSQLRMFAASKLELAWKEADGTKAPEIHVIGQNGGFLWGMDVSSATLKSRNMAWGWMDTSGNYLGDEIYYSKPLDGVGAQCGFGISDPYSVAGTTNARLSCSTPFNSGTGASTEPTIAAFIARGAAGMTAPVMAAFLHFSATELWSINVDGTEKGYTTSAVQRYNRDGTSGAITISPPTSTSALSVRTTSDTVGRVVLGLATSQGVLQFGGGGAGAVDCTISRGGANIVTSDSELRVTRASASNPAHSSFVSGDTNSRWTVRADGSIVLGSGSATGDAWLTRVGAGVLGLSDTGGGLTAPTITGLGLMLKNVTAAPSTNPAGGGIIYCEAGALKYRGTGGTITILGAA